MHELFLHVSMRSCSHIYTCVCVCVCVRACDLLHGLFLNVSA